MSKLKVAHWNCFKLTQSRHFEFENFLNIFKPDIISIQELKLNEEEARMLLRFDGYSAYIKTRNLNPDHGGGVAILIKSGIPHSRINGLDDSLEIIGLKVDLNEVCFDFLVFTVLLTRLFRMNFSKVWKLLKVSLFSLGI